MPYRLPREWEHKTLGDQIREISEYIRRYKVVPRGRPPRWREKTCPICGKKEILMPYPHFVLVCQRCLEKMPGLAEMRARGDVVPVPLFTSLFLGGARCDLCKEPIIVGYRVHPREVCLYCAWYRLGGQKRAMRVEGEYVL